MLVSVIGVAHSIRQLRTAKQWSRERLAFQIGASAGSILRWERVASKGPLRMHEHTVDAICREYKATFGSPAPIKRA